MSSPVLDPASPSRRRTRRRRRVLLRRTADLPALLPCPRSHRHSRRPMRQTGRRQLALPPVPAVAKSVAGGDGRATERRFWATPRAVSGRPLALRAALGLGLAALLLCMIAFSVMAADKTDGWAGDSYERYKEFRFLVGANVIAFVYSLYQVYERIHRMTTMNNIIGRPFRYYFDLTMDQTLAYLLMSSSSAAASRNATWVSTFGSDAFTRKAKGSIAFSFLTFFIFALSALISAYNISLQSSDSLIQTSQATVLL